MNWTDGVIIAVLLISVLIGLFRGLVAELLSLVIWVFAFWATWAFGPIVASQLQHAITTPSLRNAVAYGICFVMVLILGAIVRFTVRRLIWSSGLSGMDKMFGMLFGFLRGVLIVALMVFLMGMTGLTRESWWRESALAPQFQGVAVWLGQAVPANIPASVRDHVHPEEMLDKLHPTDMLNHMPNLSALPHVPMFGGQTMPATARSIPGLPAAATSAAFHP